MEASTDYLDEMDDTERNRLIDDRKRGLLSDLLLARIDQAVGIDGAQQRVRDIEGQLNALEDLRPN